MKNFYCVAFRAFLVAFLATFVILSSSPLLADSWDWRNVNGVNWNSTVKQQWNGTCWDFGTCGEMESKYMLTRNDSSFMPDLSDQQMLWDPPWNSYPLQGGQTGFDQILQYTTNHGIVSETELPLDLNGDPGNPPPGWSLSSGWQNRVWKTAGYQWAPLANLKNLIKSSGPIEMGFSANDFYASVADLKANYKLNANNGDNHTVCLIGFNDDPTCPTGGYWIVKNSWGPTDGDNGYRYVPYNSSLEMNQHTYALGPVYYAGPMYHVGPWDGTGVDYTGSAATKTWKGTTNSVWDTTSGTSGNWNGFQWVNQEVQAVFDSTGTNKTIAVTGKVIAHGLTVNSSGYSFVTGTGGSLTITSGGITSTSNLSISAPIYIGGPQTWNVASGATMNVTGAVHTVISDLTFNSAGSIVISGAMDGGGVLNLQGGAKAGGLIQSGSGSVTISGTTNYNGNITANAGAGTLYINPPGAGAVVWDGAYFGGGIIRFNCSALTLGSGASNFTGSFSFDKACNLTFDPAAGITSKFANVINNNGSVTQNGAGRTVLSATSTYTGSTTITSGILQANSGTGLPTGSMLILNGGMLQNYGTSALTFNRTLSSTAGSNRFYWTANGGGFSAGNAALTVNIGSGTSLSWGSTQGTNIMGTLMLSSVEAAALTTFQNNVNLNGANRTILVNDNPKSTADSALMSGVISNSTGTAGIYKTGNGLLRLSGTNTYNGSTTISGGILEGNIGTNIPTNSYLSLDGGIFQPYSSTTFTRSMGTSGATVSWSSTGGGGGFAANSSALTVNINNNGSTLAWGSTVGTNIIGTLKLNAPNSTAALTLSNGLNLNGGARTIFVDDNPNSSSDRVILSGAISGGSGSSLTKTGLGTLYIQGSTANTYSGTTTITGGKVYLNKSSVVAIPGNLTLSTAPNTPGPGNWGNVAQTYVIAQGSNQIASSCLLSFTGFQGDNWSHFETYGHSMTLAGISGYGIVENTETETGIGNSTLTINNSVDCTYYGFLRNSAGGSGTLALVKNGTGTQTIVGNDWQNAITYTGGTTVSGGKLVLQDTASFTGSVTNNATLELNATNNAWTFGSNLSGSGSLLLSGGNTLTVSGAISGSGSVTKTGSGALYYTGSANNTYSGATTFNDGWTVLAKSSGNAIPGDFTIANANTYLRCEAANQQFPTTAKVTFSGTGDPHFEVYGNTVTVGGISATGGGAIQNTEGEWGPGNGTLIVNNATDCTYSAIIRDNAGGSGTLALTKSGTGTLTLDGWGTVNYSGGTTVNGGKLVLAKPYGAAIPGDILLNPTSADCYLVLQTPDQIAPTAKLNYIDSSYWAHLEVYGNTVTLAGITDYSNYCVIENTQFETGVGNGTLVVNNTEDCVYTGYIRDNAGGSGTLALVKSGPATLTLAGSGPVTYTGGTTVTEGRLVLAKSSGYAIPGNLTIANQAAFVVVTTPSQMRTDAVVTLQGDYDGNNNPHFEVYGNTITLGAVTGTGGIIENTEYEGGIGNGTLIFDSATNYALNGVVIRDNGGGSGTLALVKNNTNTLTIAGSFCGYYTGGLTINAGTLDLTYGVLPNCTITINGGTLIYPGGGRSAMTAAADVVGELASNAAYTSINMHSINNANGDLVFPEGSNSYVNQIIGQGTTIVCDGATLTASSIVQDTLIIGGSNPTLGVVPEPCTFVLLVLAGLTLIGAYLRRK